MMNLFVYNFSFYFVHGRGLLLIHCVVCHLHLEHHWPVNYGLDTYWIVGCLFLGSWLIRWLSQNNVYILLVLTYVLNTITLYIIVLAIDTLKINWQCLDVLWYLEGYLLLVLLAYAPLCHAIFFGWRCYSPDQWPQSS